MFSAVVLSFFVSAANLSNNEPEPISNPLVYFQISIGGVVQPEKIIFKLFWEKNPITAENFKQLATGEPGFGYKNSIFHRIIEGFMCQGGDFENANGTGGKSIYGYKFDDEDLNDGNTFEKGGILAMANSGPNTNGSQFFITTGKTTHLEGKHVKIGKVAFGYDTVLKMDKVETGNKDKPIQEVKIVYSGICNGHQDSPKACDNNAKEDTAGGAIKENGKVSSILDAIKNEGNQTVADETNQVNEGGNAVLDAIKNEGNQTVADETNQVEEDGDAAVKTIKNEGIQTLADGTNQVEEAGSVAVKTIKNEGNQTLADGTNQVEEAGSVAVKTIKNAADGASQVKKDGEALLTNVLKPKNKNDEAGASGPSNTADVNATGTPNDKLDTDEKNSASSNFKMLIFALNIFYF